jgi:hypothetical protein
MGGINSGQTSVIDPNTLPRLKWETEAMKVCKEKYNHYLKAGNLRKAEIYKAKIDGKRLLILKLRKLVHV